jgi:hypothetical protein
MAPDADPYAWNTCPGMNIIKWVTYFACNMILRMFFVIKGYRLFDFSAAQKEG